MKNSWLWVLAAGVIGGFAFAAGSQLEGAAASKVKSRVGDFTTSPDVGSVGQSTVGVSSVGARTGGTY